MKRSKKIQVKIFTPLVVQAYFVLLSVAALPIILGSTVVFIAVSMANFSQQRIRVAVLPNCPPDSYSCRVHQNTTTPDVTGGTSANTGGDTSPVPDQGAAGDQGAGNSTGNESQEGSHWNGNSQGSSGETSGISGNGGGALAGKSLKEIIQEGLSFGENVDFQSSAVASIQCEYIARGTKIANDDDKDGLAQVPPDENLFSLLQEDYYKTDPLDPDTDYDSYYDGEEACNGTDPLKPPHIKNIDWNLVNRLKGKIVIQTERHGEAWYIYPLDGLRYYFRNGKIAYAIMRYLSLGITNADLAKIPAATIDNKPLTIDRTLVNRLKGRILLQVQSRGEAWYVSPADGRRYYMKDGDAAYQIMRFLSLGILNKDINKMPIGTLMGKIR